MADAADVLGPVLGAEAEVAVEAVADVVAVEHVGGPARRATSRASHAAATVDLPEPDSPVNQIVAPCDGRSLPGDLPGVPGDVVAAHSLSGARIMPAPTVVLRGLVDEDEAAGGAVAAVLVVEERQRGAQRDAADLVERQAHGVLVAVQRVDVELVLQVLHQRRGPSGWCA